MSSVGVKGAESGDKERQIRRPFHQDVQLLRFGASLLEWMMKVRSQWTSRSGAFGHSHIPRFHKTGCGARRRAYDGRWRYTAVKALCRGCINFKTRIPGD
jgi:hypothetical protein